MLLEILEPRRLRSVDGITVTQGYPGFFEIRGTEGDDLIAVSVSMADQTFTMDGTTYTGVLYIAAFGDAGSDEIILNSEDGAGPISANIYGGSDSDVLCLNFDGGVSAGNGDDIVYLTDSFRGLADGQGGDDQLNICGANIDAIVRGGDGHDYIDCSANADGLIIRGGKGNDTIYGSRYADVIYGDEGNDYIDGFDGDDTIYANDGEPDTIIGGAGYDFIYADPSDTSIVGAEEVYTS